jgi:hypothetical protein
MGYNVLRQIKPILYRLQRQYGVPVDYYVPLTNTNDVRTGRITRTYDVYRTKKTIALPASELRDFAYDLSYIAANKNFTYGGFFDSRDRVFIFRRQDFPKGFDFTIDHHIVFEHKRFKMESLQPTAQNWGVLILGQAIESVPTEEQHLAKAINRVTLSQDANGAN